MSNFLEFYATMNRTELILGPEIHMMECRAYEPPGVLNPAAENVYY